MDIVHTCIGLQTGFCIIQYDILLNSCFTDRIFNKDQGKGILFGNLVPLSQNLRRRAYTDWALVITTNSRYMYTYIFFKNEPRFFFTEITIYIFSLLQNDIYIYVYIIEKLSMDYVLSTVKPGHGISHFLNNE
jgi:hypothetical protein